MSSYSGHCHCGAIGYQYTTDVAPADWSVRACQCSFCLAHGALSTSDPRGRLAFRAVDPSRLRRYRFALKTADFLLCRLCGVYVGAVIETGSGQFGIVNTRSLVPRPDQIAEAAAISYDSEDTERRIVRREARWTPVTARLIRTSP